MWTHGAGPTRDRRNLLRSLIAQGTLTSKASLQLALLHASNGPCAHGAADYTAAGLRCIFASVGKKQCLALAAVSSSLLACVLPPGVGVDNRVSVRSGGQSSDEGSADLLFRYDRPAQGSIGPHSETRLDR